MSDAHISDPLKQYSAGGAPITGADTLSHSLLNMSTESSENLQEYLLTTHNVLGMLQKEVFLLKEELRSREGSEPTSPETSSAQERMLILCRADSHGTAEDAVDTSHSLEIADAGEQKDAIVTQFSRRAAIQIQSNEQGTQWEGQMTPSHEVQEIIAQLHSAREAAEARAEKLALQNKVDAKWYENQLWALEDDSFQLSLARSRGLTEPVSLYACTHVTCVNLTSPCMYLSEFDLRFIL